MNDSHARARQFIMEFFGDEEFNNFCFDYFPLAYDEFTVGMAKSQKVRLLVDACRREDRLPDLLVALRRERPDLYEAHFDAEPSEPPPLPRPVRRDERQIFISHAHQDSTFAHRLAKDLRTRGWRIWMAPDSIRSGEKWVEAINRGLAESGVFVLVLTEAAVSSRWVLSETNVAISMEHQDQLDFIPLEVESAIVPPLWQGYQWISFRDDYKKSLEKLMWTLQPEVMDRLSKLYHRLKRSYSRADWEESRILGQEILDQYPDYRETARLIALVETEEKKLEDFGQQVVVYTPRGALIELPEGATPIDFAYAIHTDLGNQCQLAYVNEQQYPLNKPLRNGDQVRIGKSGWARPQRIWLDKDLGFLATSRARSRVRHWFRHLPENRAIAEGKRLLQEELRMLSMSERSHQHISEQLGYKEPDELYLAAGRADLIPTTLATRILAHDWYQEPSRDVGNVVRTSIGQEYVITNAVRRELRLCRACNARPDDKIIGFVRRDGGVTVHREGCYTLRPDPMAHRTLKLAWTIEGSQEVRIASVQIDVFDRTGLLFEIAELLHNESVNISAINTSPTEDAGSVTFIIDIDVNSPRQLVLILHRTHALVNVQAVCLLRRNDDEDKFRPKIPA